jgi:hypothetical protein
MEENMNLDEMRKKFAHIKGWAIDADPQNEPTYPMKNWTGADHDRLDWERPPQQEKTVEILQSTEHLRTPAVFGTKHPPKGLSGALRRQGFRYSENMLRRWLTLIAADRVDVLEGVLDDLRHGQLPNLVKERGFDALWEYNRQLLIRRAAFRGAVYGAVIGFIAYSLLNGSGKEPVLRKRPVLSE